MKIIDKIALVLVIVGAIVWGIIGIFNINIVDALFGANSIISKIIYILVGISGLWAIKLLFDKDLLKYINILTSFFIVRIFSIK